MLIPSIDFVAIGSWLDASGFPHAGSERSLRVAAKRWLVVVAWGIVATALADMARAQTSVPSFSPVEAYLRKHCVACHGSDKPKADLSLSKFKASSDVVRHRKVWDSIVAMVEAGDMPPTDKPRPDVKETERFLADVTAIFDHFERHAPPDPGRVTMRRLNRVEYNNTIRDLFYGLDQNPAEDFPADDVGYGFDNIGDVLSLSPVLMERYLAAVGNIARYAIFVDPPPPIRRSIPSQLTRPGGSKAPRSGEYRILTEGEDRTEIETGPIYAEFRLNPYDEYLSTFTCYAKREGNEPVRVAVLVSGPELASPSGADEIAELSGLAIKKLQPCKIISTFEVTSHEENNPQICSVNIPPTPGANLVAMALLKSPNGAAPAMLYVKNIDVCGPLDTRPVAQRHILDYPAELPAAERTRYVLERFVSRAYRRPATAAEIDRSAHLVAEAEASGEKWERGIQRAIEAVLVSPKFLFRVELDDRPEAPETRPLDEYQMASRLSYFLWGSMPDDELFALARDRRLTEQLDVQVRRMLLDPKSRALVEQFGMQWLQLGRLRTLSPDTTVFPTFKDALRHAMLKETQLFFQAIIREDRSLLDLLDADFTYLNRPLAEHYGILDTAGTLKGQKKRNTGGRNFIIDRWDRVPLRDGVRGGLLSQASVLTVTSNPTRTSPVKRGKWVLEQLLGAPPPPPPPNVPDLEGQKEKLTGTLRQRMEQHRQSAACAVCHTRMDPLGFALENFDAIGAFRLTDGGEPIDASGTLPDGRSFNGPAELRAVLRDKSEEFAHCLAEKLLTFALGRGVEYYDRRALDRILASVKQDNYRFSTLCVEIARSDPFRLRRGSRDEP